MDEVEEQSRGGTQRKAGISAVKTYRHVRISRKSEIAEARNEVWLAGMQYRRVQRATLRRKQMLYGRTICGRLYTGREPTRRRTPSPRPGGHRTDHTIGSSRGHRTRCRQSGRAMVSTFASRPRARAGAPENTILMDPHMERGCLLVHALLQAPRAPWGDSDNSFRETRPRVDVIALQS